MRILIILLVLASPAFAWQPVPHEGGTAHRIEGEKISGAAETGDTVYILIEPEIALPELVPGQKLAYRNIIFNYGDDYICGPMREIKIKIDGHLIRERENFDGSWHDWHIFYKGFLSTHYGEVLSLEIPVSKDGSDLAAQLLATKNIISFERKLDNCGDDGVFEFRVKR